MKTIARVRGHERGASLIEFAMIMPLIIILLLGIVEFGWVFSQYNDVRHGAREGARLAAVNADTGANLIVGTCDSMDLTSPATVTFEDGATGSTGDTGRVVVTATVSSLSGLGLIEIFLPSTLTSDIEFRLEQDSALWNNVGPTSC